jgi:hypothetical protein
MPSARLNPRELLDCSLLPFEPTAKRPLRKGEELVVRETSASVKVSGQTFSYTFSRANGLLTRLRVLEDDFSSAKGFALPDAYLSPEKDPREHQFSLSHERSAKLHLLEASPERVILRARGRFRSAQGEAFPIRYTITHRIYIDGLDIVTMTCDAERDCTVRWLTLSRLHLPGSLCPFYAHLPDQAFRQDTGDYQFARLPAAKGSFLTGLFLPWVWLGNERTGVEITTWDVTPQQVQPTEYEFPDGGGMGDALDGRSQPMFVISRDRAVVSWENYTVRNAYLPVHRGWTIEGAFALAVTPPKQYDPRLLGLRPVEGRYGMPDMSVEEAARGGANYLESLSGFGANPVPNAQREKLRANIADLHAHGIKVVPYVSANDLGEKSPPYQAHGPEWRIEPGYSYRYRSSGMCNWAKGWRDQFKQTIDRVARDYDFDGVYIDMWFGKMACENSAHGCNTRFRHISYIGLRDQLAHAYNRLKSKHPDGLIFNNTNVLPIAYVTSLSDIRLVGESMDIMDLDPLARMFLYFSQRLGSQTAWSTYGSKLTTEQKLSLGLLVCSLLPRHPYDLSNPRAWTAEQIAAFRHYRNAFRFFGVARAALHAALSGQKLATCPTEEVYVNVLHRKDAGTLLLSVINMNPKRLRTTLRVPSLARLGLSARKSYVVYDPTQKKVVARVAGSKLNGLPLSLGAHAHAVLFIAEAPPDRPSLLFALGADGLRREKWEAKKGDLAFTLQGPAGAEVELALLCAERPKALTCGGESIPFTYHAAQQLVRATAKLDPARPFRLTCR